mgnify:CR=1 FL=1
MKRVNINHGEFSTGLTTRLISSDKKESSSSDIGGYQFTKKGLFKHYVGDRFIDAVVTNLKLRGVDLPSKKIISDLITHRLDPEKVPFQANQHNHNMKVAQQLIVSVAEIFIKTKGRSISEHYVKQRDDTKDVNDLDDILTKVVQSDETNAMMKLVDDGYGVGGSSGGGGGGGSVFAGLGLFGHSSLSSIYEAYSKLSKNVTIMLDTKRRNTSDSGTAFQRWNFSNGTIDTSDGTVYVSDEINKITAISIPDNIIIPKGDSLDGGRYVYMVIDEFKGNSISNGSFTYHFRFLRDDHSDGNNFILRNTHSGGAPLKYTFSTSVTPPSNLTLYWGDGESYSTMDADRLIATVASTGSTTTFTTTSAHNITNGTIVTISDFTAAAGLTTIIDSVNANHTVLVPTTTTFTIPIDTSTLTMNIGETVDIYVPKKRYQIEIVLHYN